MKIDVLTLFPEMMEGPLRTSILQRAQKAGQAVIRVHNIRDQAHDRHRTVDDRPYGGGPGMVMMCEPLVSAIEAVRTLEAEPARVIYLTPEGKVFDQAKAVELAALPRLVLVSGHYEGIDERVREGWIDEEISIGDYVLTNGTLPALVVIDAVVRLLPGVLGNEESAETESFSADLLEGPQYTRPVEFRGKKVPEILLTGNHAAIATWRHEQAERRTRERRMDLLEQRNEKGE
ncbi:MAG: tRNA (guanosine(37)-N1)-methyltransferase TrmD [Candidatus Methylacidiphilales bacterium]|nr:tRNA (guanosine(37)-N1)-methyltransferase TrmD [Candidatus Methylacidiphilales bacterium]